DNGKIADIILPKDLTPEALADFNKNWPVKDYGELLIFPGLIDSNVHLHANYDDEWENIEFCTRLAASSGVTTIIENPIMTTPFGSSSEYVEGLGNSIEKIQTYSKVDFGIYGILEPKTKNYIGQILDKGVVGVKCFLMKCFQT